MLMTALIYLHTSMKNTDNLQITTHTTVYSVDPFLKKVKWCTAQQLTLFA